MIIAWRAVPLLRVATALAIGIVLAYWAAPVPWWILLSIAVTLMAVQALPVYLHLRGRVRGATILSLFLVLGFAEMQLSLESSFSQQLPDHQYFTARILGAPQGQNAWLGADAELLQLHTTDHDTTAKAKVRLMFARQAIFDSLGAQIHGLGKGSLIVSAAALGPADAPRNPHTFNYKEFLANRGVHYQAWLRPGDFRALNTPDQPLAIEQIRTWIAQRIDAGFPGSAEAGVAKALLIGDKSGIDESTRLSYSATGAIHVLAVSGLHTGIIAAIIVWMLIRTFGKRRKFLQVLILILGLLAYCALTGFTPSVIRSAIMFAIVFTGRILQKNPNGLNSLGAAALVTLLYDPMLLMTLGFQLSYLAVAGIMVFHNTMKRFLASGNKYIDYVADLVAVSIAATLGTMPITIFYFHQFPLYFALSGIVAVPLVSVILPILLISLGLDALLSIIGLNFSILYYPSYLLVLLLNESLRYMAQLPYVLLEGLWPTKHTVVLMLLTLLMLGILVNKKRRRFAFATGGLFLLTGLSAGVDSWSKIGHEEIIVYSLKNGFVIDFIDSGGLVSASSGQIDSSELDKEVFPHRLALGRNIYSGQPCYPLYADSLIEVFEHPQHRWAVLQQEKINFISGGPSFDWVFIHTASKIDPVELAEIFPGSMFLLKQRPPPWHAAAWDSLGARVHILSQEGAYYPVEQQ